MEKRSINKKKKKSVKRKTLFAVLSVIMIVILSVVGYYAYHIYNFTNKIQAKTKPKMVATKEWTGGRVNILLIGGDTRSKGADNSDSMILLSADPETHKAAMFSIMRDTLWKIPGHSYHKINAGNLIGGPELAVQTVSNFLDIPINFYVETDFQGFKKMVDILGGVDINVEKDMNYDASDGTNIHLKQGEQHLNGKLALDYARFRHDAMGDFNRTKRQRELLKALAAKTSSSYGLLKIPQLLDGLAPYVQTNMTTNNMLEIANLFHGANVSNLQTEQVPQMNDILQKTIPEFGAVLIPNVLATRQYVHEQLGMTDAPTATDAEQYYWNMYENGGSTQAGKTQSVGSSHSATSGTTSSTGSSYRSVTIKSSGSSTSGATKQSSNGAASSSSAGTTKKSAGGTSSSSSSRSNANSNGGAGASSSSGSSTNSNGGNGASSSSGSTANSTGGNGASSTSSTTTTKSTDGNGSTVQGQTTVSN